MSYSTVEKAQILVIVFMISIILWAMSSSFDHTETISDEQAEYYAQDQYPDQNQAATGGH